MVFDKNKFAKRLKEIRIAKGLKQEALCAKINIEPPNYSPMETAKGLPSIPTFHRIVESLEVSPNEFFEYEHLENEKTLDEMNMKIYNSLSLKKKRGLYKILRALEELI